MSYVIFLAAAEDRDTRQCLDVLGRSLIGVGKGQLIASFGGMAVYRHAAQLTHHRLAGILLCPDAELETREKALPRIRELPGLREIPVCSLPDPGSPEFDTAVQRFVREHR